MQRSSPWPLLVSRKEVSAEAVNAIRLRRQVSRRMVLEGRTAHEKVAGNGALKSDFHFMWIALPHINWKAR